MRIYNSLKSLFEKKVYCCDGCVKQESYELYVKVINSMPEEYKEKFRFNPPVKCKPSQLRNCSMCSKKLCPTCTKTAFEQGKKLFPYKKEWIMCPDCVCYEY